jgi:hypothetical protein
MADEQINVKITAETAGATSGIQQVTQGFEGLAEAIRGPAELLGTFSSRLREGLELAGITYAIDKFREFGTEMAEIGERALNTGYALGLTTHQVGELQGMFTLAGGSADEAQRALERLGLSVQQALQDPTGTAATNFKNLGASLAEVKAHANDLPGLLRLVTELAAESANPLQRMAVLHELIGRGFDRLVPLMRVGGEGWDELKARAQDYAAALERNAAGEADSAERRNALRLDTQTLAHDGFGGLKSAIDAIRAVEDYFVRSLDDAIRASQGLRVELNPLAASFYVVAKAIAGVVAIVSAFVDAIRAALGMIEAFAIGINQVVHGIAKAIGAAVSGDWRGIGKAFGEGFEHSAPKAKAVLDGVKANIAAILANLESLGEVQIFRTPVPGPPPPAGTRAIGTEKPGGGRAGGRASKDDAEKEIREEYELFSAGERLKLQAAKSNADAIIRIYDEWLDETAAIYGRDSKEYLDLEREKLAAAQRATAERLRLLEEEQKKEEEAYKLAAEASAKSWREATRQISDQLGSLVADVLGRTKTIAAAFRALVDSLLKDFTKSLFSSLLGGSGGAGGGLANLRFGSQGLSGALGLGSGGLFGLVGAALGIGGAAQQAADVAALWGGGGEAAVLAGMGGAAAGSGGLFSAIGSMFSGLFAFLGFARGGIVPSARGGWVVPHFANGGVLSVLHQREMVLPAHISDGLQAMIANGGGGHTFNITAIDAGGVARLFANHGSALVAALNKATRNGATLYQRS